MVSDTSVAIGWAILELMGHRRMGGFVRPVELAGKGFLRIDVPAPESTDDGPWIASQLYSPEAVYCITPTTREMACAAARMSRVEPVSRWELPAVREPEADAVPLGPQRYISDDERKDDTPF